MTIEIRRALPRLVACVSSIVVAALGAWLLLVAPAQAAAFTVRADCTGQTPGTCFTTLVLAIDAANASPDADVITVHAGPFDATGLTISQPVTIEGAGAGSTTLDGTSAGGPMFTITAGITATIRSVRVQDGQAASGGAIHANGTIVLSEALFTANHATTSGGAVFVASTGTATIDDTTFENNVATNGADIFVESGGGLSVRRSLFIGSGQHIRTDAGTVSYSSFPTRDAEAINGGAGVTAENNWWGDASGPSASQLPPITPPDTDPWLSSVVFDPTSASETVGDTASFGITIQRNADGALPTGSGLRMRIVRAVDNPDSTGALFTESGGEYSYSFVGSAAGTTHVNALVEFGDSSSLPQPGDTNVLSAVATVTWSAATPTPTPEEPAPTPTPTPTPAPNPSQDMSAEDKFNALVDAGIFQGLGGGGPELDEVMDRAQFAKIAALILGLEVGNESRMTPTYTDLPNADWAAGYIEMAKQNGLMAGSDEGFGDPDLAMLTVSLADLTKLLQKSGASGTSASNWADAFIQQALKDGLIADFTGTVNQAARDALVGSAWSAGDALSLTNETQPLSTEVNEPSPVVYEIAAADLPAATRAEEIVFARLDEATQQWVSVDAEVTMNEDGSFGLVALVSESGLYAIGVRPVAERTVYEGVTALAWLGPEGQAPERALRRASASVEALFAQDVGGRWVSYRPGNPAFAQTLTALRDRQPLFVISSKTGTWLLPLN